MNYSLTQLVINFRFDCFLLLFQLHHLLCCGQLVVVFVGILYALKYAINLMRFPSRYLSYVIHQWNLVYVRVCVHVYM